MDKYLKDKIDDLKKSMYKAIKKRKPKDAIADVLDSDRIAEMSPDSIVSGKSGVLNKAKDKKNKKDKDIEKTEFFVKNVIKNFEMISKAYLMEKAKIDEGSSAKEKKKARRQRNEEFKPYKKEKTTKDGNREFKPGLTQKQLKEKIGQDQKKRNTEKGKPNVPSKKDLEYPMAASEKQ